MGRYFGRAAITWSSTVDANSLRVHVLDAPLRDFTMGLSVPSWTREALDRSRVEYFTISSGFAYELRGTVRYTHDSQSLVDMLRAGSQGKTLTYYPDLNDSNSALSINLLEPLGDAGLSLDPDLGVRGDQTVTIRFRTTGGAMFSRPVQLGTPVLFAYRAGDSLAAATFTRATSTSAPASYASLPSFGTLTTAATNQARIEWVST